MWLWEGSLSYASLQPLGFKPFHLGAILISPPLPCFHLLLLYKLPGLALSGGFRHTGSAHRPVSLSLWLVNLFPLFPSSFSASLTVSCKSYLFLWNSVDATLAADGCHTWLNTKERLLRMLLSVPGMDASLHVVFTDHKEKKVKSIYLIVFSFSDSFSCVSDGSLLRPLEHQSTCKHMKGQVLLQPG